MDKWEELKKYLLECEDEIRGSEPVLPIWQVLLQMQKLETGSLTKTGRKRK